MRTSAALQYLYLQKPISSIILICCIAVLPWIAMGYFSTKGEPREAAVAVSMLETGDWILPKVYANEFAYKPPMMHWMIAVFSLPEGKVSEFTSRLPSAIAYTLMLVFVLIFFGRKTRSSGLPPTARCFPCRSSGQVPGERNRIAVLGRSFAAVPVFGPSKPR